MMYMQQKYFQKEGKAQFLQIYTAEIMYHQWISTTRNAKGSISGIKKIPGKNLNLHKK